FGIMVGEIHKRLAGGEFLSLKKHWRSRSKQSQSRHRAVAAGAGELVQAFPISGIGHLIMVFDESNKRRRLHSQRRLTAPLLLPAIELPLIQVSVLRG